MQKLVMAPAAFNLAETTRMLEIARACQGIFEIIFISYGGDFESRIDVAGFEIARLEPRLTSEKIEHIYRVDKGEKLGRFLTEHEIASRVASELALFEQIKPVAVITGFSLTVPLSTRIAGVPLVWVIQSTWFEETGFGLFDPQRFGLLRPISIGLLKAVVNVFGRFSLLGPLNRVARRYGVSRFKTVAEFWRGDYALLAEPPAFSSLPQLPARCQYIGPLIAREDFDIPREIETIPRDLPLIYFAMGSSGTPEIIARILEGFDGAPYRVIAPVKAYVEKLSVKIPPNVFVTDWLPAHKVNCMADISVIHGGIGTVMTAALAGKPVVGVGMQPEQAANLDCLVKQGFAIRIPKRKVTAPLILQAVDALLHDDEAKHRARDFAEIVARWDGPTRAAQFLQATFARA